METALIAGLVATIVSLIGLLVNIHIARQARIATENNLRTQLLLELSAESEASLREFIVQGERLRIKCWNLMGLFVMILDPKVSSINDPDAFQKSVSQFHKQTGDFLDSWSTVKATLPEGLSQHFRTLRHECRTELSSIHESSYFLLELADSDGINSDQFWEYAIGSRQSLSTVLNKLDELISMASSVRKGLLEDMA